LAPGETSAARSSAMSAICHGGLAVDRSPEAPASSNPELLVIRPSPPSAGLNDLQPFNLSTVLMAVHKGDNPPPHKIFNLFNSRSFLLDLFKTLIID
jgi:hypothetical protein